MIQNQVSIIIPIYNVEKYLPECVDSVRNQTYSNLQIILVNDGSPDNCGSLCDEYAKLDNRINVVHKENGGLSDARNAGLPYVTGEFVYYLDSDDYLETNAFEILMDKQNDTNADIVLANFFYTYADHEDVANMYFAKDIILDNKEVMKALVSGKLETFAWGKLIRTEIARKYLFPKGKVFEDHYWTHYVFAEANNIAVINSPLVHYRQRGNSISFTFNINRLDVLEGWIDRKSFLEREYPELVEECLKQYAEHYVGIAWLILTKMRKEKSEAFSKIRKYNKMLKLQNYAEGTTKQLICALDKGNVHYSIRALLYRLIRG